MQYAPALDALPHGLDAQLMENRNAEVAHDWYRRSFDALYPVIYAHRTVESAAPEAAFAARQLELNEGKSVLDLACGNGRHLAHLLQRTRRAVGLDYSAALLARARETVGRRAGLVRADMRAVPFAGAFDAVTNFFTSFGYFFEDAENLRTVRSVAQALKPGGRFFIDYMNRAHVEATLVPRSRRRIGEYEVAEERWIDARRRRINKTMAVYKGDVRLENLEESVRLYESDELQQLLAAGGLTVDRFFGDFTGEPYGRNSPRMILVGRKG